MTTTAASTSRATAGRTSAGRPDRTARAPSVASSRSARQPARKARRGAPARAVSTESSTNKATTGPRAAASTRAGLSARRRSRRNQQIVGRADPSVIQAEGRDERLLGDFHAPDVLHALLALLLALDQLALARDVAPVALGEDVLALGLHGLPGDDPAPDG